MKEIKIFCKKCGKEMPINEKKSTKLFNVYKKKCECGGEGMFKIKRDPKLDGNINRGQYFLKK